MLPKYLQEVCLNGQKFDLLGLISLNNPRFKAERNDSDVLERISASRH